MHRKCVEVRANLNFWQLACISGLALGLPAMVVGGHLAKQYSPGTALTSICIGNLLLWIIGVAVITMTEKTKQAIENIKEYLGKKTSIFAAFVILSTFLIWYAIQIQGTANVISEEFSKIPRWQIGLSLGILTAIISTGGIKIIRWLCVSSFPLLFALAIYAMSTNTQPVVFKNTWGVSLFGILTVVSVWLPCTVNLPTLFRHAKSRDDSIFGLCLMVLIHLFFQIFTIFSNLDTVPSILAAFPKPFAVACALLFTTLAFICINLVNIYFASAGWETVFFRLKNSKEYGLIGFIGTLIYFLQEIFSPFTYYVESVESILTSFIANLGIVLIIDLLIRKIVHHRPRPHEKLISSLCWIFGCLITLIWQFSEILDSNHFNQYLNGIFLPGILATLLSFMITLFIEETIWSIKNLPKTV